MLQSVAVCRRALQCALQRDGEGARERERESERGREGGVNTLKITNQKNETTREDICTRKHAHACVTLTSSKF